MRNVSVIGNITRDVKEVWKGDGRVLYSSSVAVNEVYGSGEDRKEKAHFFPFSVSLPETSKLPQYLSKGAKVGLSGQLASWNNGKDGDERRSGIRIETNGRGVTLLGRPRSNGDTPKDNTNDEDVPF